MLIDSRLPPSTHRRSGDLGRRPYSYRGAQPEPQVVVLTMAEFRLRLGVRGGRTAYRPSGEPRRVGLFFSSCACWPGNVSGFAGAGPPMGRCRPAGTGCFEPVVGLATMFMI